MSRLVTKPGDPVFRVWWADQDEHEEEDGQDIQTLFYEGALRVPCGDVVCDERSAVVEWCSRNFGTRHDYPQSYDKVFCRRLSTGKVAEFEVEVRSVPEFDAREART